MNRRVVLGIVTGSAGTMLAGCLGGDTRDELAAPADDPFPTAVEGAERGEAELVVSRTVEAGTEYDDASIECANEVYDAVKDRLDDEFDDLSDISIGRGRGPEGFDGMAITVHLTTATYDRDGKLVDEADIEFEKLVAVTPSTAYLRTDDGEQMCAVPVYVEQGERHID